MKNILNNWLFRILALSICLGIFLANCGFQGPLYLPKKPVASTPVKNTTSTPVKAVSSSPNTTNMLRPAAGVSVN